MTRRIFCFFAVFTLFVLAGTAQAQPVQNAHVRLYSPVTAAGDKDTVPVAVAIALNDGWHAYWRTPGDAGLPPVFDWTGSENVADAVVSFPTPMRFDTFGIENLGYEHHVTFPVDITRADNTAGIDLKLTLDILVCKDVCIPETHHLALAVPAGTSTPTPDAAAYQAAVEKIPAAMATGFDFTAAWLDVDAENIPYLVVTAASQSAPASDSDLFVEHATGVHFGKPALTFDNGIITFKSPATSNLRFEALTQSLQQSPLTLTYASGDAAVEKTVTLSPRPPEDGILADGSLWRKIRSFDAKLILMALFGGLILNLMPCVLPVLSLKVLSVVKHSGSENRRAIFRNFMASAAGIIFSFWVLAAGLVALKQAGETVGWGIQFQHPGFLIFLILIVLFFAVNLWGFFEIPMPRFIANLIAAREMKAREKGREDESLGNHFLTGAFATLLATPCTAPVLSTAVGFALARGAFEIFTIFTFLGIGLAAPYILLAVAPRVFRYMPKPGAWMITLKKVMAVALFITAAWLVSVLVTIVGTPTLDQGWERFHVSRIAPAVAEGKTVIVDVTADWCLTCKANKRLVLDQEDIQLVLSAPNILKLQADWTHRDQSIADYLQSYARYGIPFNIVYGPAAPKGIILPELLSRKAVMDALAEAAGE